MTWSLAIFGNMDQYWQPGVHGSVTTVAGRAETATRNHSASATSHMNWLDSLLNIGPAGFLDSGGVLAQRTDQRVNRRSGQDTTEAVLLCERLREAWFHGCRGQWNA